MSRRYENTKVTSNVHCYRGVEFRADRGKYRARIEPTTSKRGRWLGTFATATEAAIAYDNAARLEYGEEAFLNFPGEGEARITASLRDRGLCPKGHNLSLDGYIRPDGNGVTCRVCQAEAASRYYHKKTAQKP